jgi:glyoxylase-like metal-dependent hydrolase (beta-lactamase superfamily II)
MCRVHWIQHAVGHGGFHTGQIYSGAGSRMMEEQPDFTWIFDCGSRAYSKLDAFLRLWTRRQGRPVDWLFISHFDFDHVSGLDELMSRSVVNDVMVPYVNEDELAYTLLEEIGRANVAPAFVSLVADPASFFLTRGAARVTFLRGREGERPPEVDLRPGDPGDRFETDDGWGVEMSQVEKLDMSDCTGGRSETGPVIRVVDEGLCEIKATRGRCSLLLKAYRAPVSRTANEDLMTALHARFGTMP